MTLDRVKNFPYRKYLPGFGAFFIPVALLFIAFQLVEVFPTGDRQVLMIDLYHQYAPFLAEFRRKLLSLDGVFFSWDGGLGVNFYSLFAYYLASPLNLLIVFFPPSQLSNFVLFVVLLRVGLAGFTAYTFLFRGRSHTQKVALIFSIGYALSAFMISYFWNIMWIDVVVLLPLLAYTLTLLVKFEKVWPFVLVLAFALWTNYYMAFFASAFIGLYFVVLLVENSPLRRRADYTAKVLIFAGASVLAAAMAAVLLIPAYISLGHTSAAGGEWPDELHWKYLGIDVVAQLLYGVEPNPRTGPPNIYVGLLVLLMLPIYFMARGIKVKVKVANGILAAFLFFSLNIDALNLAWHGMHAPNQLPNRFAFVLVFLLMTMGADGFREIRSVEKWTAVKVAVALIAGIFILQKIDRDMLSLSTILVSTIILAVYASLMVLLWKYPARMQRYSSVLLLIVVVEFAGSSIYGARTVPEGQSFGKLDGYAMGVAPDETRQFVEKYKAKPGTDFHRMDYIFTRTVNDPMLYGMPGLSIFSSSVAQAPVEFLQSLGIPANGINSYTYQSMQPFDALIGMKYILNRTDKHFFGGYPQVDSGAEVTVFENENTLPLAFWVPNTAADWVSPDRSPLENQNSLFEALFGTQQMYEEAPFTAFAVNGELSGPTDVQRGKQYHYKKPDGEDNNGYVDIEVTAEQSGHYYFSYQRETLRPESVWIFTDYENEKKENHYTHKSGVLDLGYLNAGETRYAQLKFTQKRGAEGDINLNVMRMDDYRYQMMLDSVASQNAKVTNFQTGSFDASVTAPEDGYMLVSSMYDPGWSAKVNGVDTPVQSMSDGFMLVPVKAGEQHLSMSYKPEGFNKSLVVSIIAFLAFFGLVWFERKTPASRKLPVGVKSEEEIAAEDAAGETSLVKPDSESQANADEDHGVDRE